MVAGYRKLSLFFDDKTGIPYKSYLRESSLHKQLYPALKGSVFYRRNTNF
ncbi:hypothetical protein NSE_0157 [Neorickettsia sennetsu str. Miyayama]|uniref:Uncharacterized protein n=1 Tax=Ehrlichia sennetsu (strain ATCC VR-367 / Miyayama) TaxID=222891 RepID=Q2GEP1_EHRS3|nr:hypothetical protein NSE_0157 [Neorickettsia sennetsu str. Miyayama]